MEKLHYYKVTVQWTGNKGRGTSGYRHYDRAHRIEFEGKPKLEGSSDPAFLGDKSKYNPEDLFVASVSTCHMLWYLHLCAVAGVIVTDYTDHATAVMKEAEDGSGFFEKVTLYPIVKVETAEMVEKANQLHDDAHKFCFIANSVNFPIVHFPSCSF